MQNSVGARLRLGHIVVLASLVLAAGGGWALAASGSGNVIKACANKKTGALRLAKKCRRNERPVSWSIQGPRGVPGKNGTNGTSGSNGTNGTNGVNGATNVVARRGTNTTIPSGGTIITASCNAGERATGGGVSADNTHITTIDSTPMAGSAPAADGSTPNGWWADVKSDDGLSTHHAFAIAICSSP